MFWTDRIADEVEKQYEALVGKQPLVIRDEKTASGRVHVGSMRGVAIHGALSDVLSERGVANTFCYEINDFDPMDGLPVYLDEKTYRPYMGMQLYKIPSPDQSAPNFAEYFGREFEKVITETGFHPSFYRGSELYLTGKMDEVIRLALERADDIRAIYKNVSGAERPSDWLPLSVVCERCGKIGSTKSFDFDGETVAYTCTPGAVAWAEGCGGSGRISPFGGNAKLPWKVEWPAKFRVVGVHIEGGGKDHSTKGGARDVANHISREVFEYEPPLDIPYEFFLVGGQKMSSSKGRGSSAREIAGLMPPRIFRLALLQKDIRQAFNFNPEGDTIPVLFDTYDRFAANYFAGVRDDFTRLFELTHAPEERRAIPNRYLPRFSQVAFIVQMPHMDLFAEIERMKGVSLTDDDRKEAMERAQYAKQWIDSYAPEQFRFTLQENLPDAARGLTDAQKRALTRTREALLGKEYSGEELHSFIHALKDELSFTPRELFSAFYIAFLDKTEGPKIGWFLSSLPREFVLTRLAEASASVEA